jgi:hypothetical protein
VISEEGRLLGLPLLGVGIQCCQHPYDPCPETGSLEERLHLVNKDEHGCFWGLAVVLPLQHHRPLEFIMLKGAGHALDFG